MSLAKFFDLRVWGGFENFDFFSPFKKKFMLKEMSKGGPDRVFGSTHGYYRMEY